MLNFLMWVLLFEDGSRMPVFSNPALQAEKPEGLYSYVEGDGSTMFYVVTENGGYWDTTERYTGPTTYPEEQP